MIRRVAAVVIALALNPALLRAQDTVLTVTVQSADIYKGPRTVTSDHRSCAARHGSYGLAQSGQLGASGLVGRAGWRRLCAPHDGTIECAGGSAPAPAPSMRTSSQPQRRRPRCRCHRHANARVAGNSYGGIGQQGGTTISHILGVGGLVGSMSTSARPREGGITTASGFRSASRATSWRATPPAASPRCRSSRESSMRYSIACATTCGSGRTSDRR